MTKQKEQRWWVPVVVFRAAKDFGARKKGTEHRRAGDWGFATKGEAYRAGEKMVNAWKKDSQFMQYWEIAGIDVEEIWQ